MGLAAEENPYVMSLARLLSDLATAYVNVLVSDESLSVANPFPSSTESSFRF